jgi:hypothetical protein
MMSGSPSTLSPLSLFCLLILTCPTTPNSPTLSSRSSSSSADPLSDALRAVVFLNKGTVRSTDNFTRLTQCNGFAECYTTWECGAIRDYLYDTTAQSSPKPPPVGMRSAVPLGGLGTGTFEVRADGSFADWQIENQGPALATNKLQNSKLPVLQGAFLGLRVGDGFAATLQTHPTAAAAEADGSGSGGGGGLPAVEELTYSGAFPFSRHILNDSRLPPSVSASIYTFSAMKLHDENASALPAVAFTAVLENSGSTPVNASFLLTLPLASTASTSRRTSGDSTSVLTTIAGASAGACLHACEAEPRCSHWDVDREGGPGKPAVPATNATVMKGHDCAGSDIRAGRTRGYTDITQCYALCNVTSGCRGFVWDSIAGEAEGQCHGKPGESCCLMKTRCANFSPKKGDTAVSIGHAAIPAVPPTPGPGCTLRSGAPAVQQFLPNSGAASGVKGVWSSQPTGDVDGGAISLAGLSPVLIHKRANRLYTNSSTMDPASAVGDYSLLAVNDGMSNVSVSSADTPQAIWADFENDGELDMGVASAAGSGAVAASASIPAGATRSLTLVFGWHFPHRNCECRSVLSLTNQADFRWC